MKQAFTTLSFLFALAFFAPSISAQDPTAYLKARLLGMYNPAKDISFIPIVDQSDPSNLMYIHRETYYAFFQMQKAARRDGINIYIISATRTFRKQATIWNNKWYSRSGSSIDRAKDILKYSSMPGTSRHHWGTDIDICSVEDSDWTKPKLQATLRWLNENAKKFGFYMPYDDNPDRTGYLYEPWHWSYYPLADYYTDIYRHIVSYSDIGGFPGASLAPELKVIEYYVLGLSPH